MPVSNIAVIFFVVLAVAACVTNGDDQSDSTAVLAAEKSVGGDIGGQFAGAISTTTYHCPDGSTVEARYPTTDTARIEHQGRTIEMASAVSASGARYVGGGWQWWTKGLTEGLLSPLAKGENIASASGMTCTAR